MSKPSPEEIHAKWKAARKQLRDAQIAIIEAHAEVSTYMHGQGAVPPLSWLTDATKDAAEHAVSLADIVDMTIASRIAAGGSK